MPITVTRNTLYCIPANGRDAPKGDNMLDNYADVLTIDDVCTALRLSRKTVTALIATGQLPCRKIGRVYRIRKSAVVNYIANDNIPTANNTLPCIPL